MDQPPENRASGSAGLYISVRQSPGAHALIDTVSVFHVGVMGFPSTALDPFEQVALMLTFKSSIVALFHSILYQITLSSQMPIDIAYFEHRTPEA